MDWDFTWLIELTLVIIVFFAFGYFFRSSLVNTVTTNFNDHIHIWLDALEVKAKQQTYGDEQTIYYFFKENKSITRSLKFGKVLRLFMLS